MSAMLKRLIRQIEARGLKIEPGYSPGQLVLSGPIKERTPAIMEALKAFKPQLLELYGPKEEKAPEVAAEPDPEPP